MRITAFTLAGILTGTLLFTSCNKYPDGPGFSMLSKKERVEGEWDLQETAHPDGTVTYDTSGEIMELTDDMECMYQSGFITVEGTWEFTDKKEKIRISIGSLSKVYTIRRLKNKELWLMDDANNDVLKFDNREKDND
ncbi:hypothetical protein D3C71_687340 [compost metagenome]